MLVSQRRRHAGRHLTESSHSPPAAVPQCAAIRRLDDCVYVRHHAGQLPTGGTTLIVHLLTPTHVYTANVGDCKSVLSSRGVAVELNTCHNPNVASERDRFEASARLTTCSPACCWAQRCIALCFCSRRRAMLSAHCAAPAFKAASASHDPCPLTLYP